MTTDNKTFIPQSPAQLKREYLETPFWFSNFGNGSSLTIVEDLPRNKPLRFMTKPGKWGTQTISLIKINDGFVTKDLELTKKCAWSLFAGLPDTIENLKGCVFANDNGRWTFVMQKDNTNLSDKSAEIARSMEPAAAPQQVEVKTINDYAEMLAEAVKTNTSMGITTTYPILQKMADKIYPNRALDVIAAGKAKGCIVDHGAEGYRGY